MRLEREQCLDLDAAPGRTWLLADGAGGLAAGCALGGPASRRHGLLVAPLPGTCAPHVFLARLEEWVLEGERALPVSSAWYPGALHPGGHTYLAAFDPWPLPRWLYRVGDVEVTREVRLAEPRAGGHGVLVRWTVRGPRGTARRLTVRPLLACRAADALTFENPALDGRVRKVRGGFSCRPYEALPALAVTVTGARASFTAAPDWYRRTEYPLDLRAGQPAHEDHFTPGLFTVEVGAKAEVVLAATVGGPGRPSWGRTPPRRPPSLGACLARAAEDHLVRDRSGLRVLARLPEADEDARTTWEALPGLLLARGQVAEAAEALLAGAREAVAAPAEVALAWSAAAGRVLDREPRARGLATRLRTALRAVGAALQGRADDLDVLASARRYALADRLGGADVRRAAGAAFLERFLPDDEPPARPEMVAAAAEPRSPLSREQRLAVVNRARAELVTPRGLRARSPADPAYRAAGCVSARWVGPFVEATLRAEGRGAAVRMRLREWLDGFLPHLSEHGLGHVSGAFDGDAPHGPSGAASDALATASLLWGAHLLGVPLA